MYNDKKIGESLARVKKKLNSLEQSKLPKSFSNIKRDFDYIKDEIKSLSQKIDDLNELERKTSRKLLQKDNLKDEVRSINRIKKEMEKKQDSLDFNKYAAKLSRRIADLEFGFENSKKEVYDLVNTKTKDFDSAKSGFIDFFNDVENKILLLKKKVADNEDIEELNSQNRSLKRNIEEIDNNIKKLQRRINLLTSNKELERIRFSFDDKQSKINSKIKNVEEKTFGELKKLRNSLGFYEDMLNELSDKNKDSMLAAKREVHENIMPRINELNMEINRLKAGLEQSKQEINSQVQDKVNFLKDDMNFLKTELRKKDVDIGILNKKIASDNALLKELKKLNDSIVNERKYDLDRIKIEKKIIEKKNEQIESFKSVFFSVALGVAAFAILGYYYFSSQGLILPDIGKKLLFAIVVLVVLAAVILVPKKWYVKAKDNLDYFARNKFSKKKSVKPVIKETAAEHKSENLFETVKYIWNKILDFLVGKEK